MQCKRSGIHAVIRNGGFHLMQLLDPAVRPLNSVPWAAIATIAFTMHFSTGIRAQNRASDKSVRCSVVCLNAGTIAGTPPAHAYTASHCGFK